MPVAGRNIEPRSVKETRNERILTRSKETQRGGSVIVKLWPARSSCKKNALLCEIKTTQGCSHLSRKRKKKDDDDDAKKTP